MRDFLVSLREFNCDQWTQSSLALQLEAQQKEAERQQVTRAPQALSVPITIRFSAARRRGCAAVSLSRNAAVSRGDGLEETEG